MFAAGTAPLLLFVPTYAALSITPGLCMLLALSVGMSAGLRRTLWLIAGEVSGVLFVGFFSILAVLRVATAWPVSLLLLRYLGGIYLLYLGFRMIRSSRAQTSEQRDAGLDDLPGPALTMRGFTTAVLNPKGWAFLIAFLPPFLALHGPVFPRAGYLLAIMFVIEVLCLLAYAGAGSMMRRLIRDTRIVSGLNLVAGVLIGLLGVLLVSGLV